MDFFPEVCDGVTLGYEGLGWHNTPQRCCDLTLLF